MVSQVEDVSRAIEFTSSIFSSAEPTSVALGITPGEFTHVFRDVMQKSIASGFSYSDTHAVILSVPYDDFLRVKYNVVSKIEPMFSLFDTLVYEPEGKCLYVFSLASDTKGGHATRILERTIEEARRSGFSSVMADCTNVKSQRLFERFGFVVMSSVRYDSFTYAGAHPFENVVGTDSIFRMELIL